MNGGASITLSPPQISRDLLVLGLGYRLQEFDQGGLGKATRRKLKTIAKNLRKTGRVGDSFYGLR